MRLHLDDDDDRGDDCPPASSLAATVRAVLLDHAVSLRPDDPPVVPPPNTLEANTRQLRANERGIVRDALKANGWNQTWTARAMDLSLMQLRALMKKHGLVKPAGVRIPRTSDERRLKKLATIQAAGRQRLHDALREQAEPDPRDPKNVARLRAELAALEHEENPAAWRRGMDDRRRERIGERFMKNRKPR